jgi:hypothetical protein
MHFRDDSLFFPPSSLALISLTFVTHDYIQQPSFLGKIEEDQRDL